MCTDLIPSTLFLMYLDLLLCFHDGEGENVQGHRNKPQNKHMLQLLRILLNNLTIILKK